MDIKQFYDVNKRTQTEQVLKNQEDIDGLKDKDTDIEQAIEDEANARVQADESLAYDIADLQNQINSFGNVFTLKGSVATYGDLPATDNHVGDVWYVEADAVGYVWIDDAGTERWEQLGLPIDLSDYITTSDLALALEDYQEKLTAGTNISIIDNVISASSGSNNAVLLDNSTQEFDDSKTLKIGYNKIFKIQTINSGDNGVRIYNDNYRPVIKWNDGKYTLEMDIENNATTGTAQIIWRKKSGTIALTSDIPNTSDFVDVASTQTITGTKKFVSSVSHPQYEIKNSNGKGFVIEPGKQTFTNSINSTFNISNTDIGDFIFNHKNTQLELIMSGNNQTDTIVIPKKSGTIATTSDISAKVPDAPTTDGTYILKVVVSSGVPTYQWVLES